MTQQLPRTELIPVRSASVWIEGLTAAKPGLGVPVSATNVLPLWASNLEDNHGQTSRHDQDDAGELGSQEEAAEPGAGLGADAVGQAHNEQDEDGEELVEQRAGLVGGAQSRVYALYEYDAQDGERGGHHGQYPGPGRQEAEYVPKDVPQIRLDAAYSTAQGVLA